MVKGEKGSIAFQPIKVTLAPAPSNPVSGRYIITFSPHVQADTFLIDTQSGDGWQLTEASDKSEVFQSVARL